MESRKIIQIEDKGSFPAAGSVKHPAYVYPCSGHPCWCRSCFGISPAIVLFMNGVGTLLFILITKEGRRLTWVPVLPFLRQRIVISEMGYPYALGGFVAVGFCGSTSLR